MQDRMAALRPRDLLLATQLADAQVAALLKPYGFTDCRRADANLQALADDPVSRTHLAEFLDLLLDNLAASADPDQALNYLERFAKAGRVSPALLQKSVNKLASTGYALCGKDNSSSAEWFYVWGLKGRYDEARQTGEPDREHLNEFSRELYRQEVEKLLENVSAQLPAGTPPLVAPDLKFHRAIGEHVGKTYSVTGELLSAEEHEKHLAVTLPNEEEKKFVANLMHEPGWIAPREEIVS